MLLGEKNKQKRQEEQESQWQNYTIWTEKPTLDLGPQEYNHRHPQIHHGAHVSQRLRPPTRKLGKLLNLFKGQFPQLSISLTADPPSAVRIKSDTVQRLHSTPYKLSNSHVTIIFFIRMNHKPLCSSKRTCPVRTQFEYWVSSNFSVTV